MKKYLPILLCCIFLTGCIHRNTDEANLADISVATPSSTSATQIQEETDTESTSETAFVTETNTIASEQINSTQFIIYCPKPDASGFDVIIVKKEIDPEAEYLSALMDVLVEMNLLPQDVQIKGYMLEESHLSVDFNHAFQDFVCTMGTSGEHMIIGSIVNTLIANYNIKTVSITIDGDIWESGHVIYDTPITFFE